MLARDFEITQKLSKTICHTVQWQMQGWNWGIIDNFIITRNLLIERDITS